MAVFYDSVGSGGLFSSPAFALGTITDIFWNHTAAGSQGCVVAAVSYYVTNAAIGDLTRTVTYGSAPMQSLGVKAWGTGTYAFTELFGLINPPKGRQRVNARISGGSAVAGRVIRGNTVSYSGVDSFGTVTNAAATTGASLSVSANGTSANTLVAAFGSLTNGLTGFNQTQRYLSNTSMSMLIGDAAGTGTDLAFTAGRTKSGAWGGLAVVINPADIVATATGVDSEPIVASTARRLARPGTNRRAVFVAEPED